MNKADEFFEWVESNQRSFKTECHLDLAHEFDPGCVADQFCDRGDEGCLYGLKTEITFNDGSTTIFNYKGETE